MILNERRRLLERRVVNVGFVAVTTLLSLVFLGWQLQSVPNNPIVWILVAVSAIATYCTIHNALLTVSLLTFSDVDRRRCTPLAVGAQPSVAFIIASYQEPFEVAKMTFDCAWGIDYTGPREIIVVDNSRDVVASDYQKWRAYVESHANRDAQIRVKFAHNRHCAGLKPGNLDLAQTLLEDAQFVVFLDVDSSLPMNARVIDEAVADLLADERLGFVQFHIIGTNEHFNTLTQAVAIGQDCIRARHLARSFGGFAMFLGHNGIWRRTTLEQTGPWLEYYRGNVMVTEDMLKSVRAYAAGYYGKYSLVRTGEWVPSSLDALESMWRRWTYGGLQVFAKHGREFLSARGVLPLEKIDLLVFEVWSCVSSLIYPVALLAVLFLTPAHAGVIALLMVCLPQVVGAIVMFRLRSHASASAASRLWHSLLAYALAESFVFVARLKAVVSFVLRRGQGWKVTPKGIEGVPGWRDLVRAHLASTAFGLSILTAVVLSWWLRFDGSLMTLVHYLPTIVMAAGLLACVGHFGREGRRSTNRMEGATIDRLVTETDLQSSAEATGLWDPSAE